MMPTDPGPKKIANRDIRNRYCLSETVDNPIDTALTIESGEMRVYPAQIT